MDFSFDLILRSLPKLVSGLAVTVELVAVSGVIGILVAIPMALARVSHNPLLRWPSFSYIFFFRGTPLLVQIFLIYHGMGSFEAVRDSILWPVLREAYWCAIIAFSLNTSAYAAEIFRGAIQAVPVGEVEAGKALGLSKGQIFRRIVWPRAFRSALPAYGNEIIFMIKSSALASTITLMDLTGVARALVARTYKPVEVYLAAGVFYLVLVYLLTFVLRRLEKRWDIQRPVTPVRAEDAGPA
jgi:polar amino acid transport system permease protein